MNPAATLTHKQLADFLLNVAIRRPVFIWGPPGIGKSSLVQQFAGQVRLPCVSLLGSQLAPEDIIGVPQVVDVTSRFCPPRMIAREQIRALSQPPIGWDVELAQWFDRYFEPLETMRSYARPSRRQPATPDIPRPRVVPTLDAEDGRTFGVVLDTSGSMGREVLAKALGAIASYSMSRDIPAARVVFCDAAPYDAGYMPPEAVADRVRVRGRGGTVLQPGIDLLERADDFPKDGPLLIITDSRCDRLRVRREHAFLIPRGAHLPFVPKGPVFRIG